jgi:prepilin-type processing-associated H-X9-DG protein
VPDGPGKAIYFPALSFVSPEAAAEALRHSGKMNVCFADRHVKLTGVEDLRMGSPLWEVAKPEE